MSAMNSEQQLSWRRHMAFDPMNAHSQADDPALVYVAQFNADERAWQKMCFQKLAILASEHAFFERLGACIAIGSDSR
jgi:hypothetical protein